MFSLSNVLNPVLPRNPVDARIERQYLIVAVVVGNDVNRDIGALIVAVTVALATTAPLESVTRPTMLARDSWPGAGGASVTR